LKLKELSERAQNASFVLPLSEVKSLISKLSSSRPVKQQWAANVISYLTKENAENRANIGPRAIKPLVYMMKSSNEKVQMWAVCAAGNCCIENVSNQNRFSEANGFDVLSTLLTSPNVNVQRWTANAIGIITMDNERNQEVFGQCLKGSIGNLVQCLDSSDSQVQKWTIFALGNIAYYKPNRDTIVKERGFELIFQRVLTVQPKKSRTKCIPTTDNDNRENNEHNENIPMSSNVQITERHTTGEPQTKEMHRILFNSRLDNETKRWVSNLIAILCLDSANHRQIVGAIGGIPILIELLKSAIAETPHPDEKVIRNVAFALGNVCIDNDRNKNEYMACGGMEVMVNLVKKSVTESASKTLGIGRNHEYM